MNDFDYEYLLRTNFASSISKLMYIGFMHIYQVLSLFVLTCCGDFFFLCLLPDMLLVTTRRINNSVNSRTIKFSIDLKSKYRICFKLCIKFGGSCLQSLSHFYPSLSIHATNRFNHKLITDLYQISRLFALVSI